jgi:Skp family chaperone for outer membrane proteins
MGEMTGDHLTKMMQAQENMENSQVDETSEEFKGASEEEQAEMKQQAGRDFTKYQAEFQAEAKLFSMCSEATSTVLKSIGEGLSSMARKQ